jgi:hypothetical protein
MDQLNSNTNSRGARNEVYMLSTVDHSVAVEDADELGTVAAGVAEVQVEAGVDMEIIPTLSTGSMLPIQRATLRPKSGKRLAQEIGHLSCR